MLPTFAGARLDRAGERRGDEAWVAARVADPASRAVLVSPEGVVLDPADDRRLARVPFAGPGGEPVLLGLEGDVALFALDAPGAEGAVGLRDAARRLVQEEGAIA